MTQVTNDYIRDLEPGLLWYDTTLEEDFVISVLPNGIKTWVFLYEYQNRQRRKTLGVYPEMSYEQATAALLKARKTAEHLGGEMDTAVNPNLSASTASSEAPTKIEPSRSAALAAEYQRRIKSDDHHGRALHAWPKYLLWSLMAAAMLVAGYFAFIRFGVDDTGQQIPVADDSPQVLPNNLSATQRAATPPDDDGGPVVSTPLAGASTTPTQSSSTSRSNSKTSPQKVADESAESLATMTAARPDASLAPIQTRLTLPDPTAGSTASSPAAGSVDSMPSLAANEPTSRSTLPAIEIEDEPVGLSTAQAPADPGSAEETQQIPVPESPASTPMPANTLSPTAEIKPATEDTQVEPPAEATAVGGSVTRAIIASGVADHEPVDDLGAYVALKNKGYQKIFFFTEMRNFSDGKVIHRWKYKGKILADVPLRVARSWGWRTYSSKELLPHMTGDWTVSVIDARGQILATRMFTFDR